MKCCINVLHFAATQNQSDGTETEESRCGGWFWDGRYGRSPVISDSNVAIVKGGAINIGSKGNTIKRNDIARRRYRAIGSIGSLKTYWINECGGRISRPNCVEV